MTNKEILEEVYKMCCNPFERCDVKSFIEQEWQKADDQELVDQYNRNRGAEDYITDVAEIERHRGLVIGEDGTVKEIK